MMLNKMATTKVMLAKQLIRPAASLFAAKRM
jgi:hypothetical protein